MAASARNVERAAGGALAPPGNPAVRPAAHAPQKHVTAAVAWHADACGSSEVSRSISSPSLLRQAVGAYSFASQLGASVRYALWCCLQSMSFAVHGTRLHRAAGVDLAAAVGTAMGVSTRTPLRGASAPWVGTAVAVDAPWPLLNVGSGRVIDQLLPDVRNAPRTWRGFRIDLATGCMSAMP